jgi:hypothetical protein
MQSDSVATDWVRINCSAGICLGLMREFCKYLSRAMHSGGSSLDSVSVRRALACSSCSRSTFFLFTFSVCLTGERARRLRRAICACTAPKVIFIAASITSLCLTCVRFSGEQHGAKFLRMVPLGARAYRVVCEPVREHRR